MHDAVIEMYAVEKKFCQALLLWSINYFVYFRKKNGVQRVNSSVIKKNILTLIK